MKAARVSVSFFLEIMGVSITFKYAGKKKVHDIKSSIMGYV